MHRPSLLICSAVTTILTTAFVTAIPGNAVREAGSIIADARQVRHCHNTPRRTYCHTREPLPVKIRVSSRRA